MFRFGKPDGTSFGLEYTGTIHAFDSGNDTIAICRGTEILDLSEDWDLDLNEDWDSVEITGDPFSWDDWEIVSSSLSEEKETLLQRAIASMYNASALCESMVNPSEVEND